MALKIEKNIPIPNDRSKGLVIDILFMKEGDSAYLSYKDYTKTVINNCVTNARLRFLGQGLTIRSVSDSNGRRIWVVKKV